MVPKFRGNSDDWLDDEESRGQGRSGSGGRRAPGGSKAAKFLPKSEGNAIVAEVYPNQCRVRFDEADAGESLLCSYRRAGVIRDEKIRERSPVAVGDRVKAERVSDTDGVIAGVCERRNHLSRPAPGREDANLQHVIAANVDILVIVTSTRDPVFNPGLVDRYLVAAASAGIEPILCLTKIDLDPVRPTEMYRALGYPIFELNSKTGTGIESLAHRLTDHTVVFCGQSGVGKTSLLRKLLGNDAIGRVGEISAATGKGKHTTTGAILLGGPTAKSEWIDTPGVREFGLADVPPKALAGCFPEFRGLGCAIGDCLHREEAGCKAQNLPRYASYRRILESLLAGEN